MLTRELEFRLRVIHAGVLTTWAIAACSALYLLLTWGGPHRPLLAGIAGAACLDALAVSRVPWRRLLVTGTCEPFLLAWNVAHIAVAAVMCRLDGDLASPFVSIFFVSVVFAASSLPRAMVITVAALDVAAVLGLALAGGPLHGPSVVWAGTLVVIAGVCATIAQDRAERSAELIAAGEQVPRHLARVVEYRDNDTGGHIDRIGAYTELLARRLGFEAGYCRQLRHASTLHDIGKVAVPDAILLKPGRLTPGERAVMETHAQVGHDMLAGTGGDLLELAATIALSHHERYDGAGYPHRVAGEAIPLPGRIVAVADVFDAITSKRVYKEAVDVERAVEIIRDGRGTQFDPRVVDAFLGALDAITAVRRSQVAQRSTALLAAA